MKTDAIKVAIDGAVDYLRAHPDEARSTDSLATARIVDGLVVEVTGPGGESLTTDMVRSVGGTASAPSPGWLLRAAEASCVATLIAMRAAQVGVALDELEVDVDSESDDRGILGVEDSVRAGPLSGRVIVRIAAAGVPGETLREIAEWGIAHCPVYDAVENGVPIAEGDHHRVTGPAAALEPVLRAIPELAEGELEIAPLPGGITNHNYLVGVAGSPDRVVVRVPGRDTHLLGIDREAEVAATRSAAALGIGPEVVAYLAADGLIVTRYLAGRVLVPADLATPAVLDRVAVALRTLHAGPAIPGTFDPVATGRTYIEQARARGVAISPLALEAASVVDRIASTGVFGSSAMAPCHNDLLAANLIDDGSAIRIVDWEYAAMGDPRFDLANLAQDNELDDGVARGPAHDLRRPPARRPSPRGADPHARRLGLPRGGLGRPPAGDQRP